MNVLHSLFWELILYEYKLNYYAIGCVKGEDSVGEIDHSTITKWVKKFCSVCEKNLDQARSGQPKIGFRGRVCQVIETNSESIRRA